MVDKVVNKEKERKDELVKARYIGGTEKIMPMVGEKRAIIKPGDIVPFKMRREEIESRYDFEEIRKDEVKDVKKGGDSK
jgi:hypothetical protein